MLSQTCSTRALFMRNEYAHKRQSNVIAKQRRQSCMEYYEAAFTLAVDTIYEPAL